MSNTPNTVSQCHSPDAAPHRPGADDADLNARAACLINPASGIANDFLNHFSEILLLIENLPILLPEMVEELLLWQPTSYAGYFERSQLPGRQAALDSYRSIPEQARAFFDLHVDALNKRAIDMVSRIVVLLEGDGSPMTGTVEDYCTAAATAFRAEFDLLSVYVNDGYEAALAAHATTWGSSLSSAA